MLRGSSTFAIELERALATSLAGNSEGAIEESHHFWNGEVSRRFKGIIVAQQSQSPTEDGGPFAAGRIVDADYVLGKPLHVDKS